jgi:hypothetical protein
MIRLEISESDKCLVFASRIWNDTQFHVKKGEEYLFEAKGKWKDFFIQSNANGHSRAYLRSLNNFKRSKTENWFALMGAINHELDFLIGERRKVSIISDGSLSFYANDVKGFYWNNSGSILLKILRIK